MESAKYHRDVTTEACNNQNNKELVPVRTKGTYNKAVFI